MKKRVTWCAVFCLCLVFVLYGGVSHAAEKVFKNLKFSTSFQAVELPVIVSNRFMDNIEQKSGGRVKFERFVGGVLGKSTEQLALVSSGSVDLVTVNISPYRDKLPLHSYMNWHRGGPEATVGIQNKLMVEIPETKAILDKEDQDNNMKILFAMSTGICGFAARQPFTTLADLKGKKIGGFPNYAALTEMGYNVISVDVSQVYESLKNGVIDAMTLTLVPAVGLKWYEVAKMWMSDGMFASGQYIFINLKTWNSLPPDIQQLFMDEARTAQAFSIEKDKADTQKNLQFFQNYRQLPDTDTRNMWERQYRILNANMLDTATKQGKEREAKVILNTLDGLVLGK